MHRPRYLRRLAPGRGERVSRADACTALRLSVLQPARPLALMYVGLMLMFSLTAAAQAERVGEHRTAAGIHVLLDQSLAPVPGAAPTLFAPSVLRSLYARRDFAPLWSREVRARELLAVLASSRSHGIDPELFALGSLTEQVEELFGDGQRVTRSEVLNGSSTNGTKAVSLRSTDGAARSQVVARTAVSGEAMRRAQLDIRLSDALLRLAYALRLGVLDEQTLAVRERLEETQRDSLPIGLLSMALSAPSLHLAMEQFLPDEPSYARLYARLRAALQDHRRLARQGGWPTIPRGRTVRPGDRDRRMPLIAERLRIGGDLAESHVSDLQRLDPALEAALRRFQARHGLTVDGQLGPQTVQAMNVSVQARIAQIEANLERLRWQMWDLPADHFLVNIAGYSARLVEKHQPVWTTRVIVGRQMRRTPLLRSSMTHVVLNPTWTVPPGILRKDMLPAAREDADSLRRKGLRLVDEYGEAVEPNEVDWESVDAESFPYRLWQPAGPRNALGRVKFLFPNSHMVYIHDTPDKHLFERAIRTFSSGCIRIEGAMELAQRLLRREQSLRPEEIEALTSSRRTTRIELSRGLPVIVVYVTAELDGHDDLRLQPDVYGRDRAVSRALENAARSVPKVQKWRRRYS
ncbi:MAG: L,D-transpeptidase family protein [Gammaproteobacteria bacterium]|nr:L,D-transpeptidase family protein [Gammaproteobacteria bacterium]